MIKHPFTGTIAALLLPLCRSTWGHSVASCQLSALTREREGLWYKKA